MKPWTEHSVEVCPWHLYSSSPVENILALLDKDKLHGVRGQGQEGLCLPAAPYEPAVQSPRYSDLSLLDRLISWECWLWGMIDMLSPVKVRRGGPKRVRRCHLLSAPGTPGTAFQREKASLKIQSTHTLGSEIVSGLHSDWGGTHEGNGAQKRSWEPAHLWLFSPPWVRWLDKMQALFFSLGLDKV